MYAHVKFINDLHGSSNGTCNVSVSYIKSFDAKKYDKKKLYEVFWSPNEEDTPSSYYSTTENPSREGVKAGYYKALVLQVAESEEKLEEIITKRRVTIATEKYLKSPELADEQTKKDLKKKKHISSLKGKQLNLEKLKDIKNHYQTKFTPSFFSNPDSNDELIPKKNLKDSEEQLSIMTTKFKDLEKKYSKETGTGEILADEKLAAAKLNVKFGVAGDSQYAKNLASMIWPPHVLSLRSVSGRVRKGNNTEGKPRLTPKKLEYLRGLFRARLISENPTMTETEQNLRLKNISKYVSEKIMS